DAEICVSAFGIAARVAKNAIAMARAEGIKVGMIRPITLWPFPVKAFKAAAEKVNTFISVELSMGQMIEDIRASVEYKKDVVLCNRAGGMIPSPEQVLEAIRKANEGGNK
ncbi:MAG: 3-methyl-2-oxobutanoate dehydrogenase subunit beta, partial [Clostridia bacterium]|nr:3-methyl-2-oxobutanoate dehydrogenase subunit beta [Clostridia bacterium]